MVTKYYKNANRNKNLVILEKKYSHFEKKLVKNFHFFHLNHGINTVNLSENMGSKISQKNNKK